MKQRTAVFLAVCILASATVFAGGPPPMLRVLKDGKWGIVDDSGYIVLPTEYDYVFPPENGITVVRKGGYRDGKRAYVAATGEFITGFEYDRAYHFFGELAVAEKDGKQGYVDQLGNEVTEFVYDYARDYYDGIGIVRLRTDEGYRMGAVDAHGKEKIPVTYGALYPVNPQFLIAELNGRRGVLSADGDIVVPFRYDRIEGADDHFIVQHTVDGKPVSAVLDRDGTVLLESSDLRFVGLSRGIVQVYDGQTRRRGLMDVAGNRIVDYDYDYLSVRENGLIVVGLGSWRDRSFGLADLSGQAIAPVELDWVGWFGPNGVAVVRDEGRFGCINDHGQVVADFVYEDMRPFSEGYAAVSVDGRWGYIDVNGVLVVKPQFDWVYDFSEGLAVFRDGDVETGKRGYLDTDGNIAIEARFDWAYSFEEGVAHVAFGDYYSGTFGYINTRGEYVWEPSN